MDGGATRATEQKALLRLAEAGEVVEGPLEAANEYGQSAVFLAALAGDGPRLLGC